MPSLLVSRPRNATVAVVVALCVVGLTATVVAYFLPGRTQNWTINGGWLTLGVAAVIACASARRRAAPSARGAWTLLLAGTTCWAIGEALWVLWTLIPAPTSPTVADFAWYAFAVLGGMGLYRLGRGARADRQLARIETAPLAAAVCALVAALIWTRLTESSVSDAGKASALAYPVLFVSAALAVLQSVTSGALQLRDNPGVAALVAGFVLEAVGFTLWCPALLDGTYVAGTHPADAVWSVGIASMALGACFAAPVSEPAAQRRLSALLPGLTLAALVTVQLVFIVEGASTVPRLLLAGAIALIGASLLVRGSMLYREQVRLLERARRANADAETARKELDGFFTLSIGLLGVADLEGHFLRLNPAWSESLGWSIDELLAHPFLHFVHPDDIDATLRVMDNLQHGADTLDFENRYRCKDGSYRWLAWKSRPNVEAGVTYATAHDVTDLRLLSAELIEARDQALEASRLKSEFLAMMSHEIRTPLNGVIGMTNLLAGTELDDEQRGYSETVGSSSEALLTIINDILDFSKIEAGQLELDPVIFELRAVVEDVGEQFAGRAHDKGLELALDIDEELPRCVHGDPNRLRQVLTNLVGNAVKFTGAGEVVVSVRTQPSEQGDVTMRFEVRDTGVGIDPADLPRLFESFTQADSSTTRRYGGSGLGLAISQRLAERMGGEIGASSKPGTGSTFWFTVRMGGAQDRAPAAPRPDLAGVRVLVVDDNATNREILEHQLRTSQMRPETAEDGASALRSLRAAARRGEAHELVLLDFNMPGLDGIEFAREVSRDPELAGVPMILLTSSGGQSEEGRRVGIQAFLTKPVRQSRLFDAIAAIMGGGVQEQPVLVQATPEPKGEAAQRLRVLVAEDNKVNQAVATMTLRKRGLDVDIAPNGAVAVAMSAAGGYAAIFMDCQMPELDGYDATREIRRREGAGPRIPIIAMTAGAMRGDREQCLAAGMDDYLSKPLQLNELDRTLATWVRSPAPGSAGATAALDDDRLLELREAFGGDDVLIEIVEVYCADAVARIDDLKTALADGDAEAMRRIAHGLKGSSGNVGATAVARLCERVELEAVGDDLQGVRLLVDRLGDEVPRAATALRAKLAVVV